MTAEDMKVERDYDSLKVHWVGLKNIVMKQKKIYKMAKKYV